MFTGIVQGIGTVADIAHRDGDRRLTIDTHGADLGAPGVGDSVSVSGVCLTAVAIEGNRFVADVSNETLSLTTLGALKAGAVVNLEGALRAGDPLGGHLVSGHVDGFGVLKAKIEDARSWRLTFKMPAELARYLAPKGSVCVDGISLTVNEVDDARFGVNIIPHTMRHTTLSGLEVGDRVNLEIDVIARYVARLTESA